MEDKTKAIDAYLESIGGLENGWRLDAAPIISSDFFDCNEGWYPLIQKLIEDLVALGWDKQVTQVKEKFGGLRFYVNSCTTEMLDRILEAEKESYSICEDCGEPGELRKDLGWYFTLCDTHYHEKRESRKKK